MEKVETKPSAYEGSVLALLNMKIETKPTADDLNEFYLTRIAVKLSALGKKIAETILAAYKPLR